MRLIDHNLLLFLLAEELQLFFLVKGSSAGWLFFHVITESLLIPKRGIQSLVRRCLLNHLGQWGVLLLVFAFTETQSWLETGIHELRKTPKLRNLLLERLLKRIIIGFASRVLSGSSQPGRR